MSESGKALTIILGVMAVVFFAISGIAFFFLHNEMQEHQATALQLEGARQEKAQVETELKEARKTIDIQEQKNKEFVERVEGLLEDLDLERGLKKESQDRNRELQAALEKEAQVKEELKIQLTQKLTETEEKLSGQQSKLDLTLTRNKDLEDKRQYFETQYLRLKEKFDSLGISSIVPSDGSDAGGEGGADNIELEKIILQSSGAQENGSGKIISIDGETKFVIVNLGEQHGIAEGMMLSVYRNQIYLGDIKVSRVLPEMSAADFIPPLSSGDVLKDDQVIIKQ
jgi:hypothetical protein